MTKIDRPALHALALAAIPREILAECGYRSLVASSDLHPHGYQIRHWLHLGHGCEVIEYHARNVRSGLPRLTASTYEEQVAIHRALGLAVVGPGERWFDPKGQLYLFDLVG